MSTNTEQTAQSEIPEVLWGSHQVAEAFGKGNATDVAKMARAVRWLVKQGQVPEPDFYRGNLPLWIPEKVLTARNKLLGKHSRQQGPTHSRGGLKQQGA